MSIDKNHPEDDHTEANQIGAAMGPNLTDELLVVTGVRSGTTQAPWQQHRVPRHLLGKSLQQLHQNGLRVSGVRALDAGTNLTTAATEPDQQPVSEPRSPRRRRK